MNTPLNVGEIAFLERIKKGDCLLKNSTASEKIKAIAERGYVRFSSERIGPIMIATGEIYVLLTEAGRTILDDINAHEGQRMKDTSCLR